MLEELGKKVKEASSIFTSLTEEKKRDLLEEVAGALLDHKEKIIAANEQDLARARNNELKESLVDRLALTEARIEAMASSLRKIAKLDSPLGKTFYGKTLENGLKLYKVSVPLGVVGVIYESRPNVTVDVFSLCFKTSNAVILKGGSDALQSNIVLVNIIKDVLKQNNIDENIIELITDTDKEVTLEFMKLNEYVDVLIPRGGKNLIQTVVMNSTIPVIETGTGNCHIYVDQEADIEMALDIVENAKTQRVGVCNACESLVVHQDIAEEFIPKLVERLQKHHVEIRGDEVAQRISSEVVAASEADYYQEYLDLIISLKTVTSIEEAITHINEHNTKHSEAIITNNYFKAQTFVEQVDASSVYVNASTRFTDGEEFGFGAEIGISTQKLHARGPMGLEALTSYKYIIFGEGQIRK